MNINPWFYIISRDRSNYLSNDNLTIFIDSKKKTKYTFISRGVIISN